MVAWSAEQLVVDSRTALDAALTAVLAALPARVVERIHGASRGSLVLAAVGATCAAVALRLTTAFLVNLSLRRALMKQGIAGPKTSGLGWLFGHVLDMGRAASPVAWFGENVRRFGSVYMTNTFLARPILWVTDPRALRTILVSQSRRWHRPMEVRSTLARVTGWNGLLAIEDDVHRQHRAIINPLFNLKHLKSLIPTMTGAVDELVPLLDAAQNETVNFARLSSALTLNVIGRTAMDVDFDALNPAKESAVTAAYHRMGESFGFGILQTLVRINPFLGKLPLPINRRFARDFKIVTDEVDAIITAFEHGTATSRGNSLIKVLFDEQKSGASDEHGRLTRDDLRDELLTFLAAGHDTTSISLAMAVFELASHPDVQDAMFREVAAAFPDSVATGLANDADAYEKLAGLATLNHVINETMRLHSPAYMASRVAVVDTEVPFEDGRTIKVAKGQVLFIPMHAMHHSERVWGADANEFRPSRWAGLRLYDKDDGASSTSAETGASGATALPPLAYLPFLSGPHACVGRQFALLELKVFLARLVERYRWSLVDKDLKMRFAVVAAPRQVMTKFERRV
ncbi:hypothetical protein H9P43_000369 [Blastocladiella emersonii ATCC 22665]|nr:hypothetical protein H9P43_000369 [Blastocladiella emersonii ATCC 22665]